jgi:uncharacterized OsmC-like protein
LIDRYRAEPAAARIEDGAETRLGEASDAFHGEVLPDNSHGHPLPFGIHRAVGGDHDLPNPGDLLSAALATCLHSTTRMVADRLHVEILDLSVHVTSDVDVRGCLLVDPSVPVGFQHMRAAIRVLVSDRADADRVRLLPMVAERCCVVFQTLKGGTDVACDWTIDRQG